MGWLYTNKPKSQTILNFFRERWNSTQPGGTFEVIDCAVVQRKTAYLACRVSKEGEPPFTFAMVCLLGYRPRDHYNFGYRDIDESSGPCARDCPERILNLLTELPETDEHSQKWRAACRENLAKRKAAPRLARGVTIQTAAPVGFRFGVQEFIFTCEDPKRLLFTGASAANSGIKFRLTQKVVRSAKVIPAKEAA